MLARIERIRHDRLRRWSAYAALPYAWLALALMNPLLLVVPPLFTLAIWKAMEYGIVSRTDPVPGPDDF
jgi:hypothetical protein